MPGSFVYHFESLRSPTDGKICRNTYYYKSDTTFMIDDYMSVDVLFVSRRLMFWSNLCTKVIVFVFGSPLVNLVSGQE